VLSKIIIGIYVLATSLALIFMKLGSTSGAPVSFVNSKVAFNLNPVIILGGCLYVISFSLYTFLIAKYDLGYIIPLGTGLVYLVIFLASFFIFKEAFTITKIVGIILILGGVALLNFKS
jgi:multidrug transporter EmrE-like cation transporter